ncbi:MAG: DUF86 domain-containing protein [Candidatus Hatepunaea meridiana]|nr:DUF86 domain-containing protein [Candidatus Hatepunaea meridiana]
MNKDIILAKVSIIKRCLERIKSTTLLDPSRLDDFDVQDIFVLNLQRAIQASIDLASHLIASEGWELPDTLKKNFDVLAIHKFISVEFAGKLKAMVGFRNIAVHDYSAIDPDILKTILVKHLDDIEKFYRSVLDHLS